MLVSRTDWRRTVTCWLTLVLAPALAGCFLVKPTEGGTTSAAPGAMHLGTPVGQLPREVRPLGYTLELEIVPGRERFAGRTQIAVALERATPVVWLHGKGLHATRVQATAGGRAYPGTWNQVSEDGVVLLNFGVPLPAGLALIDISYDAPFGRQLEGLYRVDVGGAAYAFTQFEPVSAREVFPCFDEPSFKTPFEVWLTVPAGESAIANAPELSREPLGALQRVHFATTPPLPSYLVAFAVGPFDVVDGTPIAPNDVRKAPVPLRGIAVKGQGARLAYALRETGRILDALERRTGLPYPYGKLDILAVPDFGPGAMENAGAVTFREWLLLIDPASASEAQRRAFASVMAHELAHQWFGNLVTMPWWDDIWLNEAFATWLGHAIVAELYPADGANLRLLEGSHGAMQEDARVSARMIRQPITSTHDIANAFDSITYQKGAAVLTMFEHWLGSEVFWKGLRGYLAAHAHGTATATDLVSALSTAAGRDLAPAFQSFLGQAGAPFIEAEVACAEDGTAQLKLRQSRFLPVGSTGEAARTWQVPVCARYAVGETVHASCTLLDTATGTLALEGCPAWLVPNADAAGYYRWSLATKDLDKLRRGWTALTPRERLSVVDSLRAGFESGRARAEDVLVALKTFAEDENRVIATAPMGFLAFARDHLVDEATRPAVAEYARRLYQPVLRRLGWTERAEDDGETKLLRAQVVGFLADVGNTASVRQRAARLGRELLGADGDASDAAPAAVPDDLRDVAVQLAVEDGDDAIFDTAIARLKQTNDPIERPRLLAALGSVRDGRAGRALALALDPALKVNEVLLVPRLQLQDLHTRAAAWQWFEASFDAILERISARRAGSTPGLTTAFCSEEMAARVEAFFAPRIQGLTGGPRSLASALEGIRLCAARVQAHQDGARKFFAQASAPRRPESRRALPPPHTARGDPR